MDITTDPESLEAAEAALEQAADTIDDKDERIESLEATKADLKAEIADLETDSEALAEIAAAHDLNPDDEEFEAQAVVDAHTEDLRREIAELEASLPSHDVQEDDVDDRVDALAGSGVQELEAMAGRRYREQAQAQQRRQSRSGAIAASQQGAVGGGSPNEDVEDLANGVLTAREVKRAEAEGISAAEFVEREYDVDPSEYGSEPKLMAAMSNGGDN
jgi:cell division protein FtsL